MKKDTAIIKKLLVVTIILFVVTISIIAFVGVYLKNQNKMSDVINDYTLSTEFEGNREYKFTLDSTESEKEVYVDENGNIKGEVINDSDNTTDVQVVSDDENAIVEDSNKEDTDDTNIEGYTKETRNIKANEDSVLTKESYIKSKKIIEKRLEKLGVAEYNVKLDEVNGRIFVELPDDENTDFLYELISSQGVFKVKDSQTGLELMDNSNIKDAQVGYYTENNSYTVYLQIKFNKDGKDILKDMSTKYIEKEVEKTVDEATEESEETADSSNSTTTETKIDYVEFTLDETTIMKTYFGEEMDQGVIQIPLSKNITDVSDLRDSVKSANAIATILNSGNMPNKYVLENDDFLKSTIKENDITNIKIAFASIIVIISIILLVRFGLNGLLGAILNIGYLGLVSLVIRYTNVMITISSLITTILVILMNFAFMFMLLKELKIADKASKAYSETAKKYYLAIIPVCIVAFVFSFMQNASIIGIGMILFWGLIIQALYNLIFTRNVYVLNDK